MLSILAQLTAAHTVYYAHPETPGSFCACVKQARLPGDECRLHGGRYYVAARCVVDGTHGSESSPVVLASAGDGEVIIDGTIALSSAFTKRSDGVWGAPSGGAKVLQLFLDNELQVLARFPNAKWSDKGVFFAVANWLRSTTPGTHDLATHVGILRDQGACANMSTCCARCNAHDLAKSGINATGSFGILNLWSCDTGVQQIRAHDADEASVLRYNATWRGLCDEYRGGDGRYYLEGSRALLDAPEEWLLDLDASEILIAVDPRPEGEEEERAAGARLGALDVRGRVADYALMVTNSSWLQVANLSFFASTVSITGDVSNITLASLTFNYSAVSYRAVSETAPPIALTLWRPRSFSDTAPSGFLIEDLVVRYSDGPALMASGNQISISDCLFEWNDWTAVGGSWPVVDVPLAGKAHRGTTVWIDDTAGLYASHLTFRNNGAAQSIDAGGEKNARAARIEMCSFEKQLQLQDDGAFVEGGAVPNGTSTVYVRNWATDTGKAALRWDGYFPGTLGGLMLENVAWNASAFVIKGDEHNVTRNTVFDGADISASHAAHDRPRYQDHTSALDDLLIPSATVGAGTKVYNKHADQKTTFTRNVFDSITVAGKTCPAAPNCTLPGKYIGNVVGTSTPEDANGVTFDIRAELRDPYHHDFRPCPNSLVAKANAGAYDAWSDDDVTYWIPGRREVSMAGTPVPPTASIGVHINTELMFVPAKYATSHSVFFGARNASTSSPPLKHLVDLDGAMANIARPSVGAGGEVDHLKPNTQYEWRVDTHTSLSGTVERGVVWSFTTGGSDQLSCAITPHPPPRPDNCVAAEKALCPGQAHAGAKAGDPCYTCVVTNSVAMMKAGCWYKNEPGGRHGFIESFCGN